MNKGEIAQLVADKLQKSDEGSLTLLKSFIDRRYDMIWNSALWRESLATDSQTIADDTETVTLASTLDKDLIYKGKIVGQLPPFEKWRLGSVTSRNPETRGLKRLDNILSYLRSFGKTPKDIEGVNEAVALFVKSRARKINKTMQSLDQKAYDLAKGFEKQYNNLDQSPALQKYYLDLVEDFLRGQKKLKDLPDDIDPDALAEGGRPGFKYGTGKEGIKGLLKMMNKKFGKDTVKTADEIKLTDNMINERESKRAFQDLEQLKDVAPKFYLRMTLKLKYPGITDDLIEKIMADDDPQRIAEVMATMDESFKMMDKGMDTDQIINTLQKTPRTKQADGGLNYLMGL